MKAVVVEVKKRQAAVLKEDGQIQQVKNCNYSIGDEIIMNTQEKPSTRIFTPKAVVAAVLVIILGSGTFAYATPYYYVSLDVNPSIMMEVNRFERVIGAEATNEDALEILENLDLENKNIEDAFEKAIEKLEQKGYFDEGDHEIFVASSAQNEGKAKGLAKKIQKSIEGEIEENGIEANVSSSAIGYQMVQSAREEGITPGKYNIITNLLGEEVNEENKNMSIKEIMQQVKERRRIEKNERKDQQENNAIRNQEEEKNRVENSEEENGEQGNNNGRNNSPGNNGNNGMND